VGADIAPSLQPGLSGAALEMASASWYSIDTIHRSPDSVLMVFLYSFHHTRRRRSFIRAFLLALVVVSFAGCATLEDLPAKRFSENLSAYPGTADPLKIAELSPQTVDSIPAGSRNGSVIIIVHPAYALFFREEHKSRYSQEMYDLLKYQLESEAQFIRSIARSGIPVILVLPGNYQQESVAPLSYTAYVNTVTDGSPTVSYVYSESANSGSLETGSMVTLYGFLRAVGARDVLMGGGFIGRCQKELYSQMTTYMDNRPVYIVPEISSLSPDDITTAESHNILAGIRSGDYSLVRKFIEKKGGFSMVSLPQF
jgi:hypothetical protein